MVKKLLGFIDTRPHILFHYLPLVGFVILGYYLTVYLGLMQLVQNEPILGWTSLIAVYYIVLLIGDQFIHSVVGD
jgi:hypothetical protein